MVYYKITCSYTITNTLQCGTTTEDFRWLQESHVDTSYVGPLLRTGWGDSVVSTSGGVSSSRRLSSLSMLVVGLSDIEPIIINPHHISVSMESPRKNWYARMALPRRIDRLVLSGTWRLVRPTAGMAHRGEQAAVAGCDDLEAAVPSVHF